MAGGNVSGLFYIKMTTQEKALYLLSLERSLSRGKAAANVDALQEIVDRVTALRSQYDTDPDSLSAGTLEIAYYNLAHLVFPPPEYAWKRQSSRAATLPDLSTTEERLYMLLTLESALSYIYTAANIVTLSDIETVIAAVRTKFDTDPDTVTDAELKAAYDTLTKGNPPDLDNISRLIYQSWQGGGGIIEGTTAIYFRENAGTLEYSFDRSVWIAVYPPESHDHTVSDITDFPASIPPDAHDHTVSEITDFPASMPPDAHDHTVSEITDFPVSMPPDTHDHIVSDITDFPSSMTPTAHTHTPGDVSLGNVTNDAQLKRADGDFDGFTNKTTLSWQDWILTEEWLTGRKYKAQLSALPHCLGEPMYYVGDATGAGRVLLLSRSFTPQLMIFVRKRQDGLISFFFWTTDMGDDIVYTNPSLSQCGTVTDALIVAADQFTIGSSPGALNVEYAEYWGMIWGR